jgi:hypothetical protein
MPGGPLARSLTCGLLFRASTKKVQGWRLNVDGRVKPGHDEELKIEVPDFTSIHSTVTLITTP